MYIFRFDTTTIYEFYIVAQNLYIESIAYFQVMVENTSHMSSFKFMLDMELPIKFTRVGLYQTESP